MLKKINKLQKELELIKSELQDLEKFRDTKALKRFRRLLEGERSNIKATIKILIETKEEKEQRHIELLDKANRNRSSKNKRVWNYVKSIKENYRPDLSLKDIRSQLKKHRQGLETDVSDVAWRNPSP